MQSKLVPQHRFRIHLLTTTSSSSCRCRGDCDCAVARSAVVVSFGFLAPAFDADVLSWSLLPLMCPTLLADSPQIVHLAPLAPNFVSIQPGAGERALSTLPCVR